MTDALRRKLNIPNWYPPYLEKNRIHDLFHELAWELVIQQPDDHILFLKQLLLHGLDRRDIPRIILLSPPQVNVYIVAKRLAEETGAVVITYDDITEAAKQDTVTEKRFILTLNKFIVKNNIFKKGWIFPDIPKTINQARAMQHFGILPTHVFQLIPPFSPLLYELNMKKASIVWLHYRRNVLPLREAYKYNLKEILIEDKNTSEVAEKCLELVRIKRRYKAPIISKVCLLGSPGSGCKTQAKLLAKKFNLIHVDFEYIFMQHMISRSYLSHLLKAAKHRISEYSILLTAIVHKRILQKDCLEKGWVLTGFPITVDDIKNLDKLDTPPNRIIFLDTHLSVCRNRLKNQQINLCTGPQTNLNELYFKTMHPQLYTNNMPKETIIDSQINLFCQNYTQLRDYCGSSANVVNGNQSVQWVAECLSLIMMGPTENAAARGEKDYDDSEVCIGMGGDACPL